MLGKMMGINIPAPAEHIEAKEKELLSAKEQDAWMNAQIALSPLDDEDVKKIIRLLVLKHCKNLDTPDFCNIIMEDSKEALLFLKDHNEYRKPVSPEEFLENMGDF